MSNYVMVHAQFPTVDSESIKKIYEYLEKEKWIKFYSTEEKTIFTAWYAKFKDNVTYDRVITTSKKDFFNSAKPYNVTPSLIIHVGPNMPYIQIGEE